LYRDTLTLVSLGQGFKHVMLNKICTWIAKTRAIPSLHPMTLPPVGQGQRRDSFPAKETGLCPVLAPDASVGAGSGNALPRQTGSFAKNTHWVFY